jgi:predicted ATPase/class 3 adenylate cyclase
MTEPAQPAEQLPPPDLPATILTFLIADVRGYTRFTNEHGVPAAARLADRFATICKATVARHDGQVIELRGDEALCVFSSPHAALLAAVELQGRFREEMEGDPTLPLRVGMGIDVGEVVPIQGGYRGKALNLAARLCSLAGPGEVFSSEEAVQQADRIEGLAYVERGRVQLKGFEEPVRVIHILPQKDLPENFPPLVSLIAKPSNLPLQTTPFIGREREVGEIAGLLRREGVRLVTLTGAGGTGKTRLALQVGSAVLEGFERGVYFVNLAPLTDADLVASAIAETLKVKEIPGQDILAALVEYLRDRQLLLVLDNFEHLLPAAGVVHRLLVDCSSLSILVTSRAVLHLSADHEYQVAPLAVPDLEHPADPAQLSQYDSVALFVERAQAVRPGFAVTNDNAPAVAEICYRLDGLPLAIELAAARIRLFPPQALLLRLSSRLKVLTGGARDLPPRQQALRNTVEWSYSLLSPPEQILFARLSVFTGGCTFEAAEAVCNAEEGLDLLEGMASLVEKSLLRQEGDEEPRFVMLETIREYGMEALAGRGEEGASRERHAGYFLDLAEATEPGLTGPEQAVALGLLDLEHHNLRAALDWYVGQENAEYALRLGNALWRYCLYRGHLSEGRRWLEAGLSIDAPVPEAVRAAALVRAGTFAMDQGDYGACRRLTEEGLELRRAIGDRPGAASALNNLAILSKHQGDYGEARRLIEESLAIHRELGEVTGIAMSLITLADSLRLQGEAVEARALLEEALSLNRQVGDTTRHGVVLTKLGALAEDAGDYAVAEAHYQEALDVGRTLGNPVLTSSSLNSLAAIAQLRQDYGRAAELYREGLAIVEQVGYRLDIANTRGNLAVLAFEQGAYEDAEAGLKECLVLFRELNARDAIVEALEMLGATAAGRGDHERAARLYGAADTGLETVGGAMTQYRQTLAERQTSEAREHLGPDAWQAEWDAGRDMSLDEALAYALEA